MWSRIMTRRGKFEIQAILHSAASSTSLVSSIHDSSTCLLVKLHRQIPCIAWVWQAHTRPWKWPAMYPTGPRRPGWSGLEPFTVRQVTTGEKSMKRKTLIPTSSLPECEHLHLYVNDPNTLSDLSANQYPREGSTTTSNSVVPASALIPLVLPVPQLCSWHVLLYGQVIATLRSLAAST